MVGRFGASVGDPKRTLEFLFCLQNFQALEGWATVIWVLHENMDVDAQL